MKATAKTTSQPSGCFICNDTRHMVKDCPLRHSRGCPSCGGDCASIRTCPHSHIYKSKQPGGPSAKVAEHSSPFIDLRSPSPERNDPPKREDEVPREGRADAYPWHPRQERPLHEWLADQRAVRAVS